MACDEVIEKIIFCESNGRMWLWEMCTVRYSGNLNAWWFSVAIVSSDTTCHFYCIYLTTSTLYRSCKNCWHIAKFAIISRLVIIFENIAWSKAFTYSPSKYMYNIWKYKCNVKKLLFYLESRIPFLNISNSCFTIKRKFFTVLLQNKNLFFGYIGICVDEYVKIRQAQFLYFCVNLSISVMKYQTWCNVISNESSLNFFVNTGVNLG